jgi:hypothetical protein
MFGRQAAMGVVILDIVDQHGARDPTLQPQAQHRRLAELDVGPLDLLAVQSNRVDALDAGSIDDRRHLPDAAQLLDLFAHDRAGLGGEFRQCHR